MIYESNTGLKNYHINERNKKIHYRPDKII